MLQFPSAALEATKRTIHYMKMQNEVLSHAIMLHRHRYLGKSDISSVVKESTDIIELNIDDFLSNKK